MYAIEILNISKKYIGKRFKSKIAVDSLDLGIYRGEVLGFLGPNGAGKSTTIKSIMGLVVPDTGSVVINGLAAIKAESRRSVGYLPENPSFYDTLSGREYLHFVGRAFDMEAASIKTAVEESACRLDLEDALNRPIRSYSKGMVQRLGLAQTLIHDPDIFVLDEPMSGLDPIGRAMVKEIILDLKQKGKTVFFSTHITSDVERVCDRVAVLKNGKLRMLANVGETLASSLAGYSIRFSKAGTDIIEDIFSSPADLRLKISQIETAGGVVQLVEPVRKGLEELFLELIKGGDA